MTGTHSDLPIWLQWLQAIAVPLLGLLAGWIAFQQWRTADRKVQLDLFDRRFELYDQVRDALYPIIREGGASMSDLNAFASATDKAIFLFGDDVVNRFQKTRESISNLIMHTNTMKSGSPYPRDAIDGRAECMPVITSLLRDMPILLAPYMRLDHKVQTNFFGEIIEYWRRKK